MRLKKTISLKTLTKSSVWDIQEGDLFRLLDEASKDADFKDNVRHYLDILKTAFDIEVLPDATPALAKRYAGRGFQVGSVRMGENARQTWAVRKRSISRVTDLTYENIRHVTPTLLIEVLQRNFGGGWDSLPQSIQDIILSGFDVSTTTLPADRLHRPGGMYEKKVADGYAALEIPKGSWTEAIFVKPRPEADRPKMKWEEEAADGPDGLGDGPEDSSSREGSDDDDDFDEDKLTEESYRTTFDADPEDLNLEAEDVSDDDY